MVINKITPMMKQYLSIKKNYPDTLLLYRMGDFYEMFFEDAKTASQILEVVLTSRNKNDSEPIPMCGFPYRAVNSYITKLINAGCKVAICDQIGNSLKTKGLVERKVTRVITPGMVVDDELLDGKVNNFILSTTYYKNKFGIAFLDISTGDFFVTEFSSEVEVIDEIARILPSEILISEFFLGKELEIKVKDSSPTSYISFSKNIFFDYKSAYKALKDQFNVSSLQGLGCADMYAGVGSAGALLRYIHETQKHKLDHLKPIKTYSLNNFLVVDSRSCKNLELLRSIDQSTKNNTLMSILDSTVTAMGTRLLNSWIRYPLTDINLIRLRHEAVLEALENISVRQKIRRLLDCIFDLERLVSKISVGSANANDLIALGKSIQIVPKFIKIISNLSSEMYQSKDNFDILHSLVDLIDKSIREDASASISEGCIIKDGYDARLDELISINRNTKKWILELEAKEKKSRGINTLKIKYNRVFGYYIEISKLYSSVIPRDYICIQTLAKVGRYTTETLKDLEYKIISSESKRKLLETEIFTDIIFEVKKYVPTVQLLADFISIVDCLTCFALVAHENNYCRPSLNSEGIIKIEECRHPVIEKLVDGEVFVPNSIEIDNSKNQIILITGPNMAGKSTILRQTALCVIMNQMGSFVPAEKANIAIVDKIFTRIGALDNLTAGQSTFMVEMQETANILNNSTGDSLVIIDEIGRGTSTFDGLSIAWAVAEHLHDLDGVGVKSIFATHYHELTTLESYKPKVKNFTMAAKETDDKVVFMRKLIRGSSNKSYGVQVAKLSGIPDSVIQRSKEILLKLSDLNCSLSFAPYVKTLRTNYHDESKKTDKNKIQNLLKYQEEIISMIKEADILRMNPIDALNYLNELQIKIKLIR